MSLLPKKPIRRRSDGRYDINLDQDDRAVLAMYLEQLRDLLMHEDPALRRLFPVAYVNDAEKDAAYQQMMHGDLLEARFAAIETMEATLYAKVIGEPELTRWMQAINALRLVIGTRLDVSEDPDEEIAPEDPDFGFYVLYHHLGWLLGYLVDALSQALPEPTELDLFDE